MIQFILNNEVIKTTENSGMTLVDFIREYQQLKGTKIGCREGDCGACTVLVGTLDNSKITYKSITSCISPLGNANGKHIVTVEGINLPENLNFVQKAITSNYATQCGYCTPGFVVSLAGYALDKSPQTTATCNDAISGNICRCTGYKSIEKAANSIDQKLVKKDDNNQVSWLVEEGFLPTYFKEIPQRLQQLQPTELEKEGTIVANGTDVYVRNADQLSEEKIHLISEEKALKGIVLTKGKCVIGASTTVTDILQNEQLNTIFPSLKKFLKLISSEQIRNMGTLGGNFVNASPIGDMSIFFLALNSELTIQHTSGSVRKIPFQEFHKDYKVVDLKDEELIIAISFNIPIDNYNFEKVSKRTHLDIASVNAACEISTKNNVISHAHFSMGGVAPIPKYLSKTNQFLEHKTISVSTIKEAEKVLQSEISPISDVRGTETYKRALAKQLFYAHFITLFPQLIIFQNLVSK
ncbi:FAD binding domain-containing protein [Lutibacter sp.]